MSSHTSIRVLVVDDDRPDIIVEKLERAREPNDAPSFVAIGSESIEKALSLLQTSGFDVAVIDMVMPNPKGMNTTAGLDLLNMINSQYPTIEVIILTAHGAQETTVKAMECGAFSYVDKTEEGWHILPIKIRMAAKLKKGQEELGEAKRQALLSQIAAKIIHDMRSPLAAIKGFGTEAQSRWGTKSKKLADWLNVIVSEADRIDRFCNEILDIVKGGQMTLRKVPVQLKVFFDECKPMLTAVCRASSATFRMASGIDKDVDMDAERLRRVIGNLVSNAARAVEKRWGKIPGGTVELSATLDDGWLVIQIKDNGAGMSLATVEKLFDQFPVDQIQGFGFGLQVSREIVELHGGKIAAESDIGGGTTFTIRLPMEFRVAGPADVSTGEMTKYEEPMTARDTPKEQSGTEKLNSWTAQMESRFNELVRLEALGKISTEALEELDQLGENREHLRQPRTSDEIAWSQTKQTETAKLIEALEHYVRLFKSKSSAGR